MAVSGDIPAAQAARTYAESGAGGFGISQEEWRSLLTECAVAAAEPPTAAFFAGLRHTELALARGCARGNEAAWTQFLLRYREKLYDAGRAIARDETLGRELADSLYAELYGMRQNESGLRRSKLDSYLGRGSLEGWLRAVLAQAFVDRHRKMRREVSLDQQMETHGEPAAPTQQLPVPEPASLKIALDDAFSALATDDRLLLAAYFLDGRTLAEVARIAGVHESTAQRRLVKLTAALRKSVVKSLRSQGHSQAKAEEMLQADPRDIAFDAAARLRGDGTQENTAQEGRLVAFSQQEGTGRAMQSSGKEEQP